MNFQNNRTQRESVWWLTVLVVGSLIWLFGCSTMEHSVMLGAGSGLAAGTTGGLMFGGKHRTEATLICAGVGAVIGGLASYVIHGELEKRDEKIRRNTLFNLENHGITRSSVGRADLSDISTLLASPEIEEDWIDTHIEGSRLIEGHRVFTITNGSRWDLSKKAKMGK